MRVIVRHTDLTQEELKEVLTYDPETGVFIWKVRPGYRVKVGDKAGCVGADGYSQIAYKGKLRKTHRLAWLYMTGKYPKEDIDHINGDKSDNRWDNLREASRQENCRNIKRRKEGYKTPKGVYKRSWGSYQVIIDRKSYGCYKDLELAELVCREVRMTLHGEFANHG